MFERFSDGAGRVLVLAGDESRRLGHGQIGTEHLLLGILADGRSFAARSLMSSGATLDAARTKVAEAVGVTTSVMVVGGEPSGEDLPFTDRARRALERASRLSLRRRANQVSTEHVLLSVLDVEGRAGQVLRGLGVDMVGLRDAIDTAMEAEPARAEPARAGPGTAGPGTGEPATAEPEAEPIGQAMPSCASCGTGLDAALAHRLMTSRTTGEGSQEFVVVYCSACGRVIGASRA